MNKKQLILCITTAVCVIALILFAPHMFHSPSGNGSFDSFTNEFFRKEMSNNTLSLHYTLKNPSHFNLSATNATFGDASEEGRAREHRFLLDTKKSLQAFSYQNLSLSQQLTYQLFLNSLESQLALHEYERYEEPFTSSNGIHAQLPVLLAEYTFTEKEDIDNYLALLGQIDVYFSQLLDFEEQKATLGTFMSDKQCEAVIESCEQFLADTNNNLLLTSFKNRILAMEALSIEDQDAYISKNQELFWTHVCPAYKMIIRRMTSLLGNGKNDWGLCHYTDGRDYYSLLVQTCTGASENIDELFNKINSKRDEDLSICSAVVSQNPQLVDKNFHYDWNYSNEIDMINALQKQIGTDFPSPLITSYRISYIGEELQNALAPAFYITAPIDDYTDNCIYINSAKNYSDIHLFTTLAHEGYPGHLYQTTMSYNYGLSPVRALFNYPGYVEGWATYVELMSYDYAGLNDDLSTLLSHNQAATLSLYATSDIGIHYYGWEIDELKDLWSQYGITNEAVIQEIADLILADPGNYLKYYVGYLKFCELQTQMEKLYGDNFSLKDFHETILRIGPAPFDILEDFFPNYYAISHNKKQ